MSGDCAPTTPGSLAAPDHAEAQQQQRDAETARYAPAVEAFAGIADAVRAARAAARSAAHPNSDGSFLRTNEARRAWSKACAAACDREISRPDGGDELVLAALRAIMFAEAV